MQDGTTTHADEYIGEFPSSALHFLNMIFRMKKDYQPLLSLNTNSIFPLKYRASQLEGRP
jgi:hypothetical protein